MIKVQSKSVMIERLNRSQIITPYSISLNKNYFSEIIYYSEYLFLLNL